MIRLTPVILSIALLTGCASSPDLRPTVRLLGQEFQRRAAQVRSGSLGFTLKAHEKAKEHGRVLVKALNEAKTEEGRAAALAAYMKACEADDAMLAREANAKLLEACEAHARLCAKALGGGE